MPRVVDRDLSNRELLCLAALVGLATWLRVADFTLPWSQAGGWHHLNAATAAMARNYVEQGYLAHCLAPTSMSFTPEDGRWDLALHHPILLPVVVSMSFHLFGVHEWSARVPSILSSLVGLLAIFAITRRLFGLRAAWVAGLLAATLPATAFYGSAVFDIGPGVIGLSAASFALYLRLADRDSPRTFALMCAVILAAAGHDWPGYYPGGCIAALLWRGGRRRRAVLVAGLLAASFCGHMLISYVATSGLDGDRGSDLLEGFFNRTVGGRTAAPGNLAPAPGMIGRHFLTMYGWPVAVLALAGLSCIRRATHPPVVAAIILAGIAHTVIFVEGAARHGYWVTTAAFAVIPLAAAALVRFGDRLVPRPGLHLPLVAAAVIGAFGAWNTLSWFEVIAGDDYFHELGVVVREHTAPGDSLLTPEYPAEPLLFYSRRKIIGNVDDSLIPATGLPESFGPFDVVLIPERHFASPDVAPRSRLLRLLTERGYPRKVVPTIACGAVTFFYVAKR